MSTTAPADPPLPLTELQALIRAAEPDALLVPTRIVRRVIKEDRGLEGVGLVVPHRKTYAISGSRLAEFVSAEELGLPAGAVLPDEALVLASPDEAQLAGRPRPVTLVKHWRLLYHAALDREFARLRDSGRLTEGSIQPLLDRIGRTAFAEARQVLHHEKFLLPPETELSVFCEFLTVYLELRHFSPSVVKVYFPALEDPAEVDRVAAELLDADALFSRVRLEGAPEPEDRLDSLEDVEVEGEPLTLPEAPTGPAPFRFRQLQRLALRAARQGNNVRAALLHTRSEGAASSPHEAQAARDAARGELDRLTARLSSALHLHHHEAEELRHRLPALLAPAARGLWPAAARMLFDLQKVCLDHERDLYAADLVEWAVSFGRRPMQRPLPHQREVLLVKHLRTALGRLSRIRMDDDQRRKLSILLHASLHHGEERLRERFRPVLVSAFDQVGLRPANYPERLARGKLIEELLDRVVERGFIGIGDLRDAISRNQLKLPDLGGPREFLLGDAVLKLNDVLAESLDGVYRRGEVYMRLLQRASAVSFGTTVGRWLTKYIVLPFGSAFGTVVCLKEFYHIGHETLAWTDYALDYAIGDHETVLSPSEEVEALLGAAGGSMPAIVPLPRQAPVTPFDLVVSAVLGVFFLLVFYHPGFRQAVLGALGRLWKGLKFVVLQGPSWLLALPLVRRVLDSQPVVLFRRYALRPLALTAIVVLILSLTRLSWKRQVVIDLATLAGSILIFNTGLWRLAEENSVDWLARNWHWLRAEILPGLLRAVIQAFKDAMDLFERVLYTVDEWLRFRSGQSSPAFYAKAILGLVWFLATYLIRVVINLFVEPTVNPIKHFPVVTVAAKLIIPIIPAWYLAMTAVMDPILGAWLSGILATTIIVLFPGLFGFIAWESRENWKLYRANRAHTLGKVMVGHHGERVVQFFRPGFHSGTVRKLFVRLRKAARRGDGRAFHKQREQLLHVEEAIRHFVQREFLAVLTHSKGWGGLRIHLGAVLLATNRVEFELCHSDPRADALWMALEVREGWLLARVARSGWLDRLSEPQTVVLCNALAGLYKLAGVDLVEEQIKAATGAPVYDVRPDGLVVWPEGDYSRPRTLTLEEPPAGGAGEPATPPLPLDRLLFTRRLIGWETWVATWEQDQAGKLPTPLILPEVRLLPA